MPQDIPQPEPPQIPQSNQPLPHLVVEEPNKRSPWAVAGIFVLSLMVLAIPIGIFLVSQRTQLPSQAAITETPAPQPGSGIILESKLSLESKGGIIPVDVYVKSPTDNVNLVNAHLKFDPELLAVDKIATSSAQTENPGGFNKWLEVNSDNNAGKAVIIAGAPNPGVKTSQDDKIFIATLHLRPKKTGMAVLQVTPESGLLRNSDSQNIFQTGNDLALSLSSAIPEPATPSAALDSKNNNKPVIVITNPQTASNYSYFKPIDIIWSSFDVELISQINLYVNGELYGPLAQNVDAKLGKFTWKVQDTLPLPQIQLANTFSIEVIGVGKDGEVAKAITGPFGIIGQETVTGSLPNPEVFAVNPLTVSDASRLLSNYLVLPLEDKALDFNKDEVINEIDFYLLKQNLLGRGIIK